MSVFERFQAPPPGGWVTVLEEDCQFMAYGGVGEDCSFRGSHSIRQSHLHGGQGSMFEDILVQEEDGGKKGAFVGGSNFLLPPSAKNSWKRVWDTWWEQGTLAALQTGDSGISSGGHGDATPLFQRVTCSILHCAERLRRLWTILSPHSQMSMDETISKYSSHLNWGGCVVRALALHPRLEYLALARQDDEVDVRSFTDSSSAQRVVLRDRQQVAVTCMEWAPHCDSLLAVGTSTGLLLWHVDPASPTTKFVSTWVRYESSPGHAPLTSLSWSPWGNFIVSSSPRDSSLLLWDIPLGVGTCVGHGTGGGVSRVAWSPDGRRVFAGKVSAVFQVWETSRWTSEQWGNSKGRCKVGCWSDKGDMLLFAVEGDSSLYYITFHGNQTGLSTAIKCADLSPYTLTQDEQEIVGGEVQDMVWDPSAQRLAVTFTVDSPGAELVAIFRTRKSELLELLPGGFVRGKQGEHPATLAFKPNYSTGALLAVAWSSGRVSFIPFHFQNPAGCKPEPMQGHTPATPAIHPPSVIDSLKRPSLNRIYESPSNNRSNPGTPLYSVHSVN